MANDDDLDKYPKEALRRQRSHHGQPQDDGLALGLETATLQEYSLRARGKRTREGLRYADSHGVSRSQPQWTAATTSSTIH